jgi:signal transduction histidine kinase
VIAVNLGWGWYLMMAKLGLMKKFSLSDLLDYFIPADIQVNPEAHRRARMFMLSHVFGPIIGSSLPLYLVIMNISRDYRAAVFFFSILAFWVYPFLLRWTGRYQTLALMSVQNLIFCVLWACYAFGAMGSPFVPWILLFPLLAFLYLPPTGWVRNVLLTQIFGSLGIFLAMVVTGYEFPAADLENLQVIGMISMAAVAFYFAMMSLYFAKMFHEQREFSRELNGLVSTSDNVRNLTAAANQASAAKADFVASMSHELRTPLNAIIGYSQLLLEEAVDENDDESVADLGHVNKAGSDLLRLIDDILDYSRIEAGKMPVNGTFSSFTENLPRWMPKLDAALASRSYSLTIKPGRGADFVFNTDWDALGGAFRHLATGIAARAVGTHILTLTMEPNGLGGITLAITDDNAKGTLIPEAKLHETFDHHDDASPTKYGGTGIEIALAHKFAKLIDGIIKPGHQLDGSPANLLIIPDLSIRSVEFSQAA